MARGFSCGEGAHASGRTLADSVGLPGGARSRMGRGADDEEDDDGKPGGERDCGALAETGEVRRNEGDGPRGSTAKEEEEPNPPPPPRRYPPPAEEEEEAPPTPPEPDGRHPSAPTPWTDDDAVGTAEGGDDVERAEPHGDLRPPLPPPPPPPSPDPGWCGGGGPPANVEDEGGATGEETASSTERRTSSRPGLSGEEAAAETAGACLRVGWRGLSSRFPPSSEGSAPTPAPPTRAPLACAPAASDSMMDSTSAWSGEGAAAVFSAAETGRDMGATSVRDDGDSFESDEGDRADRANVRLGR